MALTFTRDLPSLESTHLGIRAGNADRPEMRNPLSSPPSRNRMKSHVVEIVAVKAFKYSAERQISTMGQKDNATGN